MAALGAQILGAVLAQRVFSFHLTINPVAAFAGHRGRYRVCDGGRLGEFARGAGAACAAIATGRGFNRRGVSKGCVRNSRGVSGSGGASKRAREQKRSATQTAWQAKRARGKSAIMHIHVPQRRSLHRFFGAAFIPLFINQRSMTETLDNAPSVFELVGGEARVRELIDRFYDLMDLESKFAGIRALHPPTLEGSRDKFFWFLCGWMGGPDHYVSRFGHPRLRARHLPYAIGGQRARPMVALHGLGHGGCRPGRGLARTPADLFFPDCGLECAIAPTKIGHCCGVPALNHDSKPNDPDTPSSLLDAPCASRARFLVRLRPGRAEYGQERRLWFKKSAATDQRIRELFGPLHAQALAGRCDCLGCNAAGRVRIDRRARPVFRATLFRDQRRRLRPTRKHWVLQRASCMRDRSAIAHAYASFVRVFAVRA